MMRFFSLIFAVSVLTPLAAQAANWAIDPATSTVSFSGVQNGEPFTVSLPQFSADITFDPANLATSAVTVELPLATMKTETPMVQQEIGGSEWLDVKQFPSATFTASSFRKIDDTHFEANGTLTLRSISKPVVLPFTFTETDGKAHVVGSVTLTRNDFGVGQGDWATDPSVAQGVRVDIALDARKIP